jgi:type II secretory pathway component PulF
VATYTYIALTQDGRRTQGSVVAPTRPDAIRRLLSGGHNVLDLREDSLPGAAAASSGRRYWRRPIRLSAFARQMATLSASGVPLVQSLNVIIEQSTDPHAIQILTDVRTSVEGGSTLANALAQHPRVFPRILTGMVAVGEMGGTLDEVLSQLAELYEKDEGLKSEVQAAMAYPILVMCLGITSAILLLTLLVPRLKMLFEGAGQALPWPTQVMLFISDAISSYGWLVVFLVPLLVIAWKAMQRSHEVRRAVGRLQLRIPWVGRLIRAVSIARFARLLGTLMRGGISFVEGMDIVQSALSNPVIADAVAEMSRQVRTGESVAVVMKKVGIFPAMPIQMAAIGEETGHLDQMLLRVAEAYERESAATARVIVSLLAPVMILCVACVVGFIILSMLLPIFQLSSVIK